MRTRAEDVKGLGRVVRGQVSASGGVVNGSGFSVAKTGTGTYTVTFLQPFRTPPVVTLTGVPSAANVAAALSASPTPTTMSLVLLQWLGGTANAADSGFTFIATEGDPA